jgi:hypothetical protein
MSPDSTFVATLAELRRAVLPGGAETTRDSAGRAAVRDSILRKYHVTPLALEDIARGLSRDPNHAAEILRAIDRKVQILQGRTPLNTTSGAPRVGHPPADGLPGAVTGTPPAVVRPNQVTTTPTTADPHGLLNNLRPQVAPNQKVPPSAGVAPRP